MTLDGNVLGKEVSNYDLRALYKYELQELHDATGQTAAALPTLVSSLGSVQLRSLVDQQAAQATKHRSRLATVLTAHGVLKPTVVDPVATALLHRAESFAAQVGDADLRDAALLSVLHRVVHHGIAACTAVSSHAKVLSLLIDRHLLTVMLGELRAAERDLADMEEEINQLALLVSLPAYL